MKLKAKQKVLGSALGLCLAALVIDRQFLGLSEATADVASVEQFAVGRDGAAPGAAVAVTAPSFDGLAAQFDSIAQAAAFDLEAVPDAFTPSPAWQPPREPVAVAPAPAAPTAGELFAAAHRLTATMAGSEAGCAIIDGRMLFIGQSLDGFTLVEVSERSATLVGAEERLVLPVEETAVR